MIIIIIIDQIVRFDVGIYKVASFLLHFIAGIFFIDVQFLFSNLSSQSFLLFLFVTV